MLGHNIPKPVATGKNANLPNLNERLQRELDILWDNGSLDEKNLKLFVTNIYEHLMFK